MHVPRPEDIQPWQRPAEPDHPMVVEGGFAPGDVRFMLRCLCEELLISGIDVETLGSMMQDPNYQALHAARHAIGAAEADKILTQAARAVGAHRVRIHETNDTAESATLTISAKRT